MEDDYPTETTYRQKWLDWRKNMPQERAMAAGFILMVNAGLHLAWTLFNSEFNRQLWYTDATIIEVLAVQGGWFVGSIVGGFNAGYFIDSMGRRKVIRIGIAAQIISSVILIFSSRSLIGMIFGRIISGYGYGCGYIALIVYGAEIATKFNRGKLISLMHLGLIVGIMVFTIIIPFTVTNEEIGPILTIGIISGVLSLFALAINQFYSYESPVILVTKDMDMDAQECLVKLRSEKYITLDIREDFHSIKEMVARDSRAKGTIYRIPTFYFLLLLKFVVVISYNFPLNVTRMNLAKVSIASFYGYNLQSFILALIKVLIGFVVTFVVDATGRRALMTCATRISGIVGFALAIAYVSTGYHVAGVFNIIFEVVSSAGIATIVDVYSGEAFTTNKKGIGLSLVHCFESLMHIVLLTVGVLVGDHELYIMGTVMLFLAGIFLLLSGFISYPETKGMSLIEATKQFMGINIQCNLC